MRPLLAWLMILLVSLDALPVTALAIVPGGAAAVAHARPTVMHCSCRGVCRCRFCCVHHPRRSAPPPGGCALECADCGGAGATVAVAHAATPYALPALVGLPRVAGRPATLEPRVLPLAAAPLRAPDPPPRAAVV